MIYYLTIVWILINGSLAVKETLGLGWWKGVTAGAFGWLLVYILMLNFLNTISTEAVEEVPVEA